MTTTEKTEVRFRWVADELYQTRGSYGYDTEEETKAAEDEEIANLDSGNWEALGCIAELVATCPHCGEERVVKDASLWGIVVNVDDAAYKRSVEEDLALELKD